MEVDNKYIAGRGTTALGIIGTTLGGLATALVGGLGGGYQGAAVCSDNTPVTRYEMGMQQTIAKQEAHIQLLEADKYTDQKIADLYSTIAPQISAVKDELRNVAVYQATNTATISCLGNQVNCIQSVLSGLTKTVIPAANICPQPMPMFNAWEAPAAPSAPAEKPAT